MSWLLVLNSRFTKGWRFSFFIYFSFNCYVSEGFSLWFGSYSDWS